MLSESFKQRIKELSGLINEGGNGTPRNMSYTSKYSAKYRNNKVYPFHKTNEQEEIPDVYEDSFQEISTNQIHIPKHLLHVDLNPKIWDNDILKPVVRKQIIKIADEFYRDLDIEIPVQSVKLVGSMANYNWSSQSDIDIHLFFDIGKNKDIVKKYFDAKKNLWNLKHTIMIKGFMAELYAQDITEEFYSGGVYNVLKNEWEIKPTIEKFEIDKNALSTKIVALINQIEHIENIENDNKNIVAQSEILKDKIKRMRQCGLEKNGEFSLENLAFKYLRNNGYLDRLHTISTKALDASLSLKEVKK